MKVTFDTLSENEVNEVVALLENMGRVKVGRLEKGVIPTETAVEEPKTKKATPSIPKEEKAPEEPKKTPTKKAKKEETKASVSLADLKDSAKNSVARSSREDVKKTIAEFAEKLAEVAEADYGKLYKKLQELGA